MPKKWWLISDEDVQRIRADLWDIDTMNSVDQDTRESILHRLDSGLHTTDAVPADFGEEAIVGEGRS